MEAGKDPGVGEVYIRTSSHPILSKFLFYFFYPSLPSSIQRAVFGAYFALFRKIIPKTSNLSTILQKCLKSPKKRNFSESCGISFDILLFRHVVKGFLSFFWEIFISLFFISLYIYLGN